MNLNELDLSGLTNDLDKQLASLQSEDSSVGKQLNARRLQQTLELIEAYKRMQTQAGTSRWFVPGTPFSIEACPKHKAFFDAGAYYTERLFMAGNRCHAAGTMVWMADGTEKPIEDIRVGDTVLAFDKTTETLVPSTVVDTYAGIADNVYEWYTPTSSRSIFSTDDHEFLVRSQRGVLRNVEAGQLKYWDKVVVPTKWDIEGVHPGFSENVAKLLGLLVGDGYLAAKDDQFKLTNKNEQVLQFAEKVAREELGLDPRRVAYRNYTDLYFPKTEKKKGKSALAKLLIETGLWGTKSSTKFVPEQIMLAPEGHVLAFVQGLLAADGHYRKGRIELYTSSDALAKGFSKACLRLGVATTSHTITHRNPNHSDQHVVAITGDSQIAQIGTSIYKQPIYRRAQRKQKDRAAVALKKGARLPKQEVYCITVDHQDHLFVANGYVNANCGKSIAGAFEASCHATGEYPLWWIGKTFDRPTAGWAIGGTARSTRDTVQKELLGPIGAWGTGMIPADKLGEWWALQGTPQAVDVIKVRHKSGGWSTIGFKNYQQPIDAFYGTALDWAWMDEECPHEIYNEVLVRTMTTGGVVFNTFTPLKGLTPMVVRYAERADYLAGAQKILAVKGEDEDESEGDARLSSINSPKAIIQAGWDDAPWLSEEAKERMLADTPTHMQEARRNGKPSLGSGNVYPLDLEHILCEPFEIPKYYKRMYALDVGWNRTAVLWGALDPQTDTLYIYDEYYVGEQPPAVHAAAIRSRGDWIPGVIDPASRGRSQTDGSRLWQSYRNDLGLRLHTANNEVDAGIHNAWHRMTLGKLKVFNTLPNFAKEYTLYRRDLRGRIVKENDHLMDCLRYIVNNLIRAKSLTMMANSATYKGTKHYDI